MKVYVPNYYDKCHNFNCCIEQLDQAYNFRVFTDHREDCITLITGYNFSEDYNSYFSGKANDMRVLGQMLIEAADQYEKNDGILRKAAESVNRLKSDISKDAVKSLEIDLISIYSKMVGSPMFGSLILEVKYVDGYSNEHGFRILSDNVVEFDFAKSIAELKKNKKDIKITFDEITYHKWVKEIKDIKSEYEKVSGKGPASIKNDDLGVMVDNLLAKIDRDYGGNKE